MRSNPGKRSGVRSRTEYLPGSDVGIETPAKVNDCGSKRVSFERLRHIRRLPASLARPRGLGEKH
jgi:hypothetical protein